MSEVAIVPDLPCVVYGLVDVPLEATDVKVGIRLDQINGRPDSGTNRHQVGLGRTVFPPRTRGVVAAEAVTVWGIHCDGIPANGAASPVACRQCREVFGSGWPE